MSHEVGPERVFVDGEYGLCTEVCEDKTRHYWKCTYAFIVNDNSLGKTYRT